MPKELETPDVKGPPLISEEYAFRHQLTFSWGQFFCWQKNQYIIFIDRSVESSNNNFWLMNRDRFIWEYLDLPWPRSVKRCLSMWYAKMGHTWKTAAIYGEIVSFKEGIYRPHLETLLKIMLVQNEGFTAEAQRTQRNHFFVWRWEAAKQKAFCRVDTSLILGAIAIKKVRSYSRREDVSDPIAVSRLDQKGSLPQRSPRLCGRPDFERGECQSKSPMKSAEVATKSTDFGQQWLKIAIFFTSFY